MFLDEIEVAAEIGIHDFERGRRQRVLVSVSVDIDPALLPNADNITATIDYDEIRALVKRLVAEHHFDLQETLCRAILLHLIEQPGFVAATVETKKPDVYPDARSVGCRLSATRSPTMLGQS